MDNKITIRELLETYDSIIVNQVYTEDIVMFKLFEKDFLIIGPSKKDLSSKAQIYLYNDEGTDYPHVVLKDIDINKESMLPIGKYRGICLYEHESVIQSLFSYEEKIIDIIDRLIKLLSMTKTEQEREFQREFLYYWNSATDLQNIDIYLKQDIKFTKLEKYCRKKTTRYVESNIELTDINNCDTRGNRIWQRHIETEAFFIPIIDKREILPPYRNHSWTIENIKEIIYGKQINHISADTYFQLKNKIVSTQNIIIVFAMRELKTKVCFAVMVKCKNGKKRTLFDKIYKDGIDIVLFNVERKDYLYLNEIIGNDSIFYNKKVLLVGGGSLGSYVAPELVENGASNIVIYDEDKLEDENKMRWRFGGWSVGLNKAEILGFFLERFHPQVHVDCHKNNLDEASLELELQNVDLIIFTIGNSDEQLKFNRVLNKLNCKIPVFFVWLEAGGMYSHILVVNYKKQGCFECLYTNKDGKLVNNRAALNTEIQTENSILRNGCGGTRAAYGTSILLRTVSVLLNTIQKFFSGNIKENILIDISSEMVSYPDDIIPMKGCNCCGNRK